MRHTNALAALGMLVVAAAVAAAVRGTQNGDRWTPISDGVLHELSDQGKKPSWPGGTAGVSVDCKSGDAYIVVPDQGLWRSADRGKTFRRVDAGAIGGRCETGYALNADPAGGRLACFMLDGHSAMTLDAGRTWLPLAPNGRGWDFGAVDWSAAHPSTILALHHESGGELYVSTDAGATWKLLGKDYTALGVFDSHTLVASKGDGILRTVDGGATWSHVCETTPTGRVAAIFHGVGYWPSRDGLLVSRDAGATWQRQGAEIEAAWGPYFGRDAREIAIGARHNGQAGLWISDDAGASWRFAAPMPDFSPDAAPDWTASKYWGAGWFVSFGWDWRSRCVYASRMGHPTVKWSVDGAPARRP